MRTCSLALLAIVLSFPVEAAAPGVPAGTSMSLSLRARALNLALADPAARPTGQCIFTCGDQMVKVARCASGDCPDYDCKTGVASCPTR